MKRSAFVTALLAVAFIAPVGAFAQTDATVIAVYEIDVRSSFGTAFTDCLRFSPVRVGELNIDGFGSPLVYRFGGLNSDRTAWKAVTVPTPPFAIMFFGKFQPFGRIRGEALSEFGDTFVFTGVFNEDCPAAVSGRARNWRSR
jgi:hypothetical protein